MTRDFSRAVVGAVADTFDRCIRPPGSNEPIDLALARRQHAAYVDVLARLGLSIHRVDADDRFPDGCFVEDPAVVVGDVAVMCESAAPARRGEGASVEEALSPFVAIHRMQPPATMDGGDVARMGRRLFVGMTARTNGEAVRQVAAVVEPSGYRVTPVAVRDTLHLKSACTRLDEETLLVDPTRVDVRAFDGYALIEVPAEEAYAANCLSVNGTVVVSAAFPRTRDRLGALGARRGFDVVELDMSEFRKAGGSLTCLSLLL